MDAKERFSTRVENYAAHRPGYPKEVVELARRFGNLTTGSRVADVGSGTGIFSRLLLDADFQVFAIEPNRAMREVAEKTLGGRAGFTSINAAAEATTLEDASVELVTAAQAFHWFDVEACRREWLRILKPPGNVMLVWNNRLTDGSPFLRGYEALLEEFGTDYRQVRHANDGESRLAEFFNGCPYETAVFENSQSFDFAGLKGRLLSSSYVPAEGDARSQPMLEALERLFEEHAVSGQVQMTYKTHATYGRIFSKA